MASRPAQKARQRAASSNGKPPQPKAGTVAQREMIEDLANSIMATERAIWRVDMEVKRRGKKDTDPAFQDGRPVSSVKDDEKHLSWKELKEEHRESLRNLESAYPTLMPVARKMVRKTRKELDAQE